MTIPFFYSPENELFTPSHPIVFMYVAVNTRVVYTMTFCACVSFMVIVRIVLWLEN
jgi:predicted nucleic acid-binding Zn finger protein